MAIDRDQDPTSPTPTGGGTGRINQVRKCPLKATAREQQTDCEFAWVCVNNGCQLMTLTPPPVRL